MTYEDRYQKICFDAEDIIKFSSKVCRLTQQADKELKNTKHAEVAVRAIMESYKAQVGEKKKELEAKDKEIRHEHTLNKVCLLELAAKNKEIAADDRNVNDLMDQLDSLGKKAEEIKELLIKHGDVLGGKYRHEVNNLLDTLTNRSE